MPRRKKSCAPFLWKYSHFLFAWTLTDSFLRQKSVSQSKLCVDQEGTLQICSTYENSSANKLHLKPTAPLYYIFWGFSRMDCYIVRNSTKYVMHIFAFLPFHKNTRLCRREERGIVKHHGNFSALCQMHPVIELWELAKASSLAWLMSSLYHFAFNGASAPNTGFRLLNSIQKLS